MLPEAVARTTFFRRTDFLGRLAFFFLRTTFFFAAGFFLRAFFFLAMGERVYHSGISRTIRLWLGTSERRAPEFWPSRLAGFEL
jgi:hypothetical protein